MALSEIRLHPTPPLKPRISLSFSLSPYLSPLLHDAYGPYSPSVYLGFKLLLNVFWTKMAARWIRPIVCHSSPSTPESGDPCLTPGFWAIGWTSRSDLFCWMLSDRFLVKRNTNKEGKINLVSCLCPPPTPCPCWQCLHCGSEELRFCLTRLNGACVCVRPSRPPPSLHTPRFSLFYLLTNLAHYLTLPIPLRMTRSERHTCCACIRCVCVDRKRLEGEVTVPFTKV